MVKREAGRVIRERKLYQISRIGYQTGWIVHNSNIDNLSRAIIERVYLCKGVFPLIPKPSVFKERCGYFRDRLSKLIGLTTPWSVDEFVATYRGRKHAIYTKAAESLLISDYCKKDAVIQAFVKAERVNSVDKPVPVARVIQPRRPRYNVALGVYIKRVEHLIYKAVTALFGEITIMKCLNAVDQAKELRRKWLRYRNPIAIGIDAERFDQHVSRQALEYEHSIYIRAFGGCKRLINLLAMQISNVGYGMCCDGFLRYSVDGCRMSGDMNTGLGNCVLMCSMIHSYMKHVNITKYSLANNGDDCILIFEADLVDEFTNGFQEYFNDFGFRMKVEPAVSCFERIEFCQTSPVLRGDGTYIMVRNPLRAISKDSISIVPLDTPKGCMKQLTALGECGLSLTKGIPVLQSFYNCLLRSGCGHRGRENENTSGYNYQAVYDDVATLQIISQDTRYSFYLAFGVEPDMQIAIESYYNSLTINPSCGKPGGDLSLPPWL